MQSGSPDEVDISEVGAAAALLAAVVRVFVTPDVRVVDAAQHDFLPRLARRRPEQDQHRPPEC